MFFFIDWERVTRFFALLNARIDSERQEINYAMYFEHKSIILSKTQDSIGKLSLKFQELVNIGKCGAKTK